VNLNSAAREQTFLCRGVEFRARWFSVDRQASGSPRGAYQRAGRTFQHKL
jgi:hypothetical protein